MNVLELISRVDFSLPEKLDCHFAGRRKTAFTLAEALITLGIIGVVAAMTLPAIVQNYKQQVIISKLNKFYNTITNAYSMAKIKNGDISNWDLKNYKTSTNDEEDILYYLLPYLKIAKFCGKSIPGCFPNVRYKALNESSTTPNLNSSWYSKAILNNGMLISSLTYSNCSNSDNSRCGLIRLDVNADNPPNVMGIDLHTFAVYKDKIVPMGLAASVTASESLFVNRGDYCTAHVIYGKSMSYIKNKKCELWE